jgi:hypothetical protein
LEFWPLILISSFLLKPSRAFQKSDGSDGLPKWLMAYQTNFQYEYFFFLHKRIRISFVLF